MSKIHIGTSGFSYKHWGNDVFYPKGLKESEWFHFGLQGPTLKMVYKFLVIAPMI